MMSTKKSSLLSILVLVMSLLSPTLKSVDTYAFSGVGDGTYENPYRISSCQELAEIEDDLSGTYKLTADLDCTADGNNIVTNGVFIGSLDGQSYSITYDLTDVDFLAGLFHNINGSTIENLTLNGTITLSSDAFVVGGLSANIYGNATISDVTINTSISGPVQTNVGGVAGTIDSSTTEGVLFAGSINNSAGGKTGGFYGTMYCSSTIQYSHSSGSVTANGGFTGGITGDDECEGPAGTYTNVSNSGLVSNDGDYVGGIVGRGWATTFNQVYNTGYIEGINNVGGIAGLLDYESGVYQSYNTGLILAYGSSAGGIVGHLAGSSAITQSFSNSVVTVQGDNGGGLLGYLNSGSNVYDSYSRGEVHGNNVIGGLIGFAWSGSINNSYSTSLVDSQTEAYGGLVALASILGDNGLFWDSENSVSTSAFGHGKSTAELKDIATYTSTASPGLGLSIWDFVGNVNDDAGTNEVWNIFSDVNDGFPCLSWEETCTENTPSSPDSDGDGLSDEAEDAGPNNGDANNDGTPDKQQDNVVAIPHQTTGKNGVLELSPSCEMQESGFGDVNALPTADSSFSYPHGMFEFSADCGGSGSTFTVKQYYYDVDPANFVVRKYNTNTQAYGTIEGATITQQTIDGRTVTVAQYQITDGGPLDMDGQANGSIVDPAGIGVADQTPALAATGQPVAQLIALAVIALSFSLLIPLVKRQAD